MIALAVWPKLVRSASATLGIWDVKSESVRATVLALRFAAIPDESSTTPKNIASMTGTITANSTAMVLRQSFNKARRRNDICCIGDTIIASRLHMKGSSRREQPLAIVEVRDIEARSEEHTSELQS